jgi:hypothetical protein
MLLWFIGDQITAMHSMELVLVLAAQLRILTQITIVIITSVTPNIQFQMVPASKRLQLPLWLLVRESVWTQDLGANLSTTYHLQGLHQITQ